MEEIFYEIIFSDEYLSDIKKHQKAGQKIILKKIATFLLELKENPTFGTGQIEPLKDYGERNIYSRRVDKKHRLIYEVFEEEKCVEILSAYGHYDDR